MRSALFQFFTIKAMTIENIENHMAYTCKCGGVNFVLLKSGGIECNKCSTPLDDVKWWAGGMGAQLARAIKAEDERDALKAALPVGELPTCQMCGDKPYPGCNSEFQGEKACRFYQQDAMTKVKYVPVDSNLRTNNWTHPNDDEMCDDECHKALDVRGDDRGQGLDGYWKWGFKAGWNARAILAAARSQPTIKNCLQVASSQPVREPQSPAPKNCRNCGGADNILCAGQCKTNGITKKGLE